MFTEAYIVDAIRTPRAKRKGKFTNIHPVDLLTIPLKEIVNKNAINSNKIEDVIIGCVTQVKEQSWCIARAASLAAGLPIEVPGVTINRLCGSGQQAFNFATAGINSGNYNLAIAGGIEHMTRAPMFSDGGGEESIELKKLYPHLVHQGLAAELISEKYNFTRETLDQFSLSSHQKATTAQANNKFNLSICPVKFLDETNTEQTLSFDDNVRKDASFEALSALKPVFKDTGVITAGNASAIVDAASCVLLASEKGLKENNLKPKAKVSSYITIGSDPYLMLTGPIAASKKLLEKLNLKISDMDLWEINEAFAPVPLATIKELNIDPSLVNVNGGGISLGHPLGATGTILINTALDELIERNKKYALITMCIGLGMGIATVIERV